MPNNFTCRQSELLPMTDEIKSKISAIDSNVSKFLRQIQGNYCALFELHETLSDLLDSCDLNLQCIRIIPEGVRFHAALLCDIQREEMSVEFQLSLLVSEPQFLPYRKVFARFGFGRRVEALLLSVIYPFENYLAADGKPDIKIRKGRKSGQATKRHLSQRRFCKALGCAPSQESSGDINRSRVSGGSDLCRKALWQWIFTRIEPQRARLNNEIGSRLGEIMDEEKLSGRPVKLVRARVVVKAVKMLFREFVREFVYSQNSSIESEIEHQELLE